MVSILSILFFVTGLRVANGACVMPKPPQNGRINVIYPGYLIKYECNGQAKLEGYPRSICSQNQWSHKVPSCILPASNPVKPTERTSQNRVSNAGNKWSLNSLDSYLIEDGQRLNDDIFSQHIRRYYRDYRYMVENARRVQNWSLVLNLKAKFSLVIRKLIARRKAHYKYLKMKEEERLRNSQNNKESVQETTEETEKSNITGCRVNNGGCAHICKDLNREISCSCRDGHMLVASDGVSCVDVNECASNFGRGPCYDKCVNSVGSYQCYCTRRGTKLSSDAKTCQDIDECETNNHGCSHVCTNAFGTAFCRCPAGYLLGRDGKTCKDINECELSSTRCEGQCMNTQGGYNCVITTTTPAPSNNGQDCYMRGLKLNEYGYCEDINECLTNNFGCSHTCYNYYGGAFCTCPYGFKKVNSKQCQDVNECETYHGKQCQFGCENLIGSYRCACPPGFRRFRNYCIDINECKVNNGGCSHECINQRGNVKCRCPKGFELLPDRKTCQDINECQLRNPCHHTCINFEGGYRCGCKPGYLLLYNNQCTACRKNSYMIPGKDVCEECPQFSHTQGDGKTSITDCICNSGFTGDLTVDDVCTDIDECGESNFNCSDVCVNTPGGAYCTCSDGFEIDADEKTCVDVNECIYGNGGCEHDCQNLVGGYECSCHDDYIIDVNDNSKCLDIDECEDDNGGCSHRCVNYNGGHYCDCDEGQRLSTDHKTCIDVLCPNLPRPSNSRIICDGYKESGNYVLRSDTICTIRCSKGYELIGDEQLTCLSNGSWSHSIPHCSALKCPTLSKPVNGNVSPSSCHEGETSVTQKCYYTCENGYVLVGNAMKTCKRSQNWSLNETPICQKDIPKPFIQCPDDIELNLEHGKNSKEVEIPKPISNMDENDVFNYLKLSKIDSERNFTFYSGITKIDFAAVNPITNETASCVLSVNIKDLEIPIVEDCPQQVDVEAGGTKTVSVSWNEPKFSDNVGVENLWKSNEPGSDFGPGDHTVTYTANDAFGNTAQCSFTVTVKRRSCLPLLGPENGNQNCMDWLYGQICQPNCNQGHMWYNLAMYEDKPKIFACGADAVWKPAAIIPDCIEYKVLNGSKCIDGEEKLSFNGNDVCVKCPRGTFGNEEDTACKPCPVGTFSDEFGGKICKECPLGFTTLDEGSTLSSDCSSSKL